MANSVASEAPVEIARILAERLPNLTQIGQHFSPRPVEHRADQFNSRRQSPPWGNAAQTLQTRAAQQAVQDGFGLIIRRVSRRDPREAACGRDFGEKTVALAA